MSSHLKAIKSGVAFALMFFGFFRLLMQVWQYSLPQAGPSVAPGPLLVVPLAMIAGRCADLHTLYLKHVVLALATALLCLRVDMRPAAPR